VQSWVHQPHVCAAHQRFNVGQDQHAFDIATLDAADAENAGGAT
jgi:hypothetical protein